MLLILLTILKPGRTHTQGQNLDQMKQTIIQHAAVCSFHHWYSTDLTSHKNSYGGWSMSSTGYPNVTPYMSELQIRPPPAGAITYHSLHQTIRATTISNNPKKTCFILEILRCLFHHNIYSLSINQALELHTCSRSSSSRFGATSEEPGMGEGLRPDWRLSVWTKESNWEQTVSARHKTMTGGGAAPGRRPTLETWPAPGPPGLVHQRPWAPPGSSKVLRPLVSDTRGWRR